jgi:TPR repeat protein
MKRALRWLAVCLALAAIAPPALAAAPDAGALWRDFLAHGSSADAYDGYDLLVPLGYDLDRVDADACREHAAGLADGLRKAPVSIALHHAALLCARATGDRKAEAAQSALLDALSADALSQASVVDASRPIRVLGLQDAYSLLHLAGLELRYSVFASTTVERYFPIVMAGWDEGAQVERHLRFDLVDVAEQITRGEETSGFPHHRTQLAEGLVEGMRKSDQVAAIDLLAVKDAYGKNGSKARVEVLRAAAARGGVQSTVAWLALCDARAFDGCADGLIDALLPQAEKRDALPMTLLAYAYAQGLGVARDVGAAKALLAAADKRWPRGAGSETFATMWLTLHRDPPAGLVAAAIADARAAGNRNIDRDLARLEVDRADKPGLDAATLALLAQPAQNGIGAGEGILAAYYRKRGDEASALEWDRKGAAHGNADAQSVIGNALVFGNDAPRDREAGIAMLHLSADGGNVAAMRMLATLSVMDGRWDDAWKWLLDGVERQDIDAILDMADLIESGHAPGKMGPEKAAAIYEELADPAAADSAQARRRLAIMALDGRGMKKNPARARGLFLHDAAKGDHDSETWMGMALLGGAFGKVDEKEGREWLERAMRGGNVHAYNAFADWLYERKTPESRRQAVEAWKKSIALGDDQAVNDLSWYQCVSPDPTVRDAREGLRAMRALAEHAEFGTSWLDTEAACLAANGEYQRAAEVQEAAIERARRPQSDDADSLGQFEHRRALYVAGKPYIAADDE